MLDCMDTKLGVFFTCYTETESVEYAIDTLFLVYPNIPVYLVSDGGSDFSFLEKKYGTKKIKTILSDDTRGLIPKISKTTFKNPEWQSYILNSIVTFFNRVEGAINFCNTEYLLVMEPDVLVRGELNIPQNMVFSGSRINKNISTELREIIKKIPGAIDVNNWGATPALFRSDVFIKAWNKLKTNPELLNKMSIAEHRLANYDMTFAVLFALIGIPEEYNPDIIECLRDSNWEKKKNPLVHQFRRYYPKNNYTGTHAADAHSSKRWYEFWKSN
jgi:hypothetical protein